MMMMMQTHVQEEIDEKKNIKQISIENLQYVSMGFPLILLHNVHWQLPSFPWLRLL